MNHPGIWLFEPALDCATNRWNKEEIHFTRAERAVLDCFFANPGLVLTRGSLLDAVSGIDGEAADRSIDFLVHRLRRKLADSARDPLYIATRYGEGYIWTGPAYPGEDLAAGSFIAVGPVHGLQFADDPTGQGLAFSRALAGEIDRLTPDTRAVVFDPDCPSPERFTGPPPQFAVDLNFVTADGHGLDCALRVRSFENAAPIMIERVSIGPEKCPETVFEARAAELAAKVTGVIWTNLQVSGPGPASAELGPLPVGLHAASAVMAVGCESWEDATRRLRQRLRATPDDPYTQISLATTLHSQYVLAGTELLMAADERDSNDAEIEHLVRQALPRLPADGSCALTAAKLLYFANRNNRRQALSIAARALDTTVELAAGLTVCAQLQMWEGELERALQLYDQALALSDYGTTFHIYLLVLKSQAAMALDPAGAAVVDALYTIKPATRAELGLFLAPTARIDLGAELDAVLKTMSGPRARASLRFVHYGTARHFRCPRHRRQVMHRPAALLIQRFGAGIVPPDVRHDTPVAETRRPRPGLNPPAWRRRRGARLGGPRAARARVALEAAGTGYRAPMSALGHIRGTFVINLACSPPRPAAAK